MPPDTCVREHGFEDVAAFNTIPSSVFGKANLN